MRAICVSAPNAVVRTISRPSAFTAPPVTLSPGLRATGRLSPVINDSSAWLSPSTTSPSTAMRWPGRTTTRSPSCSSLTGSSVSTPPRRTRAVVGRRACSASNAASVRCLARASIHLPKRTRVMTTAALSKYKCGMPSGSRHHMASERPKAAAVPRATSTSMLALPARRAAQPALKKRAPKMNCTGAASRNCHSAGSIQCRPSRSPSMGSTSGALSSAAAATWRPSVQKRASAGAASCTRRAP